MLSAVEIRLMKVKMKAGRELISINKKRLKIVIVKRKNLLKCTFKRTLKLILNPPNQLNLSKSNLKPIDQTIKNKNLRDKIYNVKKRKSWSLKTVKRTKRNATKSQLSQNCNPLPHQLKSFRWSQARIMKTFGRH